MASRKIHPYTLEEARDLLAQYKQCEKDLVNGQAQEYKIGSREFRALDLPFVRQQIKELAVEIAELSGAGKRIRVQRVVPRG